VRAAVRVESAMHYRRETVSLARPQLNDSYARTAASESEMASVVRTANATQLV
jgi:hypothetical protein